MFMQKLYKSSTCHIIKQMSEKVYYIFIFLEISIIVQGLSYNMKNRPVF